MAREYPKDMFHKTLPVVRALNTKEEQAYAAKGYQRKYIFKQYPRFVFHPVHADRLVQDESEFNRYIDDGWSAKPVPKAATPITGTVAPEGRVDAEAFQKQQIMEFELENCKEQIQTLIGIVADLQKLVGQVDELTNQMRPVTDALGITQPQG